MSIQIGQGSNRNIIFKIKFNVVSDTDTILFALKGKNSNEPIFKYSQKISELEQENDIYTFIVNLSTQFTLDLALGKYFYDLTLIDEQDERVPLTGLKSIDIVETIGAKSGVDNE